MGLITETKMLYNTFNEMNKATMMVKLVTVKKGSLVGYVTYRESYDPERPANIIELLNADVASDLFDVGPITLKLSLAELDKQF